jgi:hypothetical protein
MYAPGERTSRLDAEGDSFYKIFLNLAPEGSAKPTGAAVAKAKPRIRVYLGGYAPREWFPEFVRHFCRDFVEPAFAVEYAEPVALHPAISCPVYTVDGRRVTGHWYSVAFQSVATGKWRLLTTHDRPDEVMGLWNLDPDMVDRVFTGQFVPGWLAGTAAPDRRWPWHPWTYGPRYWGLVDDVRAEPGPVPQADLFFRGLYSARRAVVKHLAAHRQPGDLLDIECWEAGAGNPMEPEAYLRELRRHAMALSLAGAGDICNRDVECFALGVPVLRPMLAGRLVHPLESGVHYVGVPFEAIGPGGPGPGPDAPRDPNQLARDLLATYRQVRDDRALLRQVATEARAYYDRYCAYPASGRLTFDLLDLESL